MTGEERSRLNRNQPYYQRLDPVLKEKFEARLEQFRSKKKFMRNGGGPLPDGVILMISATAVQISFGLDQFTFPHFNTIIVYPDTYISPFLNAKAKGEVNPKGALVLSWQDYLEGYKNYDDGYNVGLHEMAHVLFLENLIPNREYKFLSETFLEKWRNEAESQLERFNEPGKKFLRKYASVDMHELFAVSVEAFFEKPDAFCKAQPQLYHTLRGLLNQDPRDHAFPVPITH